MQRCACLAALQADLAIPPLKIVGYEGLFGAVGMTCIMLPIVQRLPGEDGKGIHEDSLDTLHVRTRFVKGSFRDSLVLLLDS